MLAELEQIGVVTETGLKLTNPNLSFERAEALAAYFAETGRRCAWYLGDLLVYGEKVYGQSYAQLEAVTGYAASTLANRVSVCKQIPPDFRKKGLSFDHHAAAAYIEPQVREEWFQQALENGWNREEFRHRLTQAGLIQPRQKKKEEAIEEAQIIWLEDYQDWQGDGSKTVHTCPNCGEEFEE